MSPEDEDTWDYARTFVGLIDPEEDWDQMEWWARDHDFVRWDEISEKDVLELMENFGIDLPDPHCYHDDQSHPGTIRWCTDPICRGGRND